MYRTVIGIENLKNEYRKAKLIVGDLKGLGKNKFALTEKFGINPLQTFFFATTENLNEINVEFADTEDDNGFYEYNMADMVQEAKRKEKCFITIHCRTYTSKFRNDSNTKVVDQFYFQN